MSYTKIDISEWERGELFSHYINKNRVVMSLTCDIDVAPLLEYTKQNGLKFYPAMIWAVSKIINAHDEFKFRLDREGNLIKWDFLSPSYTDFHKEDENFVKFVTEYSDDLADFHARALEDIEKYKGERAFVEGMPENFFDVSCLPWIRYTHFDIHTFGSGKFLAPIITWGKYQKQGDKTLMPVTISVHHAVCDGYHLCRFFTELEELIAEMRPPAEIQVEKEASEKQKDFLSCIKALFSKGK